MPKKYSCKDGHKPKCLKMIGEIKQSIFIFMLKNILNLEGVAVLSKEQQKNINGGYGLEPLNPGLGGGGGGTGTCAFLIPKCTAPGEHGPHCNNGSGPIVVRNVDKQTAEAGAGAYGGNWCCSSCSGASWF